MELEEGRSQRHFHVGDGLWSDVDPYGGTALAPSPSVQVMMQVVLPATVRDRRPAPPRKSMPERDQTELNDLF
jgi:hypothetical protein